jgi:hypothetical protein
MSMDFEEFYRLFDLEKYLYIEGDLTYFTVLDAVLSAPLVISEGTLRF